jgi:uncharacterized membrane protein YoaK (UPF0700 family)
MGELAEAWRMLAPPRGDRHGPLSPLLLGLTVLTGLVDAFSYLALGHVFVANMTGNVVFLAFALAGAKGFSIPASLLALAAFLLGAVGGGRLISRRGGHRARLLVAATTIEAVLAAAALVVTLVVANPGRGAGRYALIAVLGLAMGLQNATARRLAVPDLTTTVLTLTLTGIAADARLLGGQGSRAGRRVPSVLAMFVGALVGGLLVEGGSRAVDLAIVVVLLVAVAAGTALLSRSDPAWVQPLP